MPQIESSLKNQKDSTQSLTFSHAARLHLLIFQYPFDSFSLATNKQSEKTMGQRFSALNNFTIIR